MNVARSRRMIRVARTMGAATARLVLCAACAACAGCGGRTSSPSADSAPTHTHTHTHTHSHDAGIVSRRGDGGFAERDGGAEDLLRVPRGFPQPIIPEDNPLTPEKIELGRRLFYDKRLSGNGTQSCGTCHEQAKAFTDGRAQGRGSTGQVHPRGSMSVANVAYLSVFTWGNPLQDSLERQTLGPMFGTEPVELGLVDEAMLVERLRGIPFYASAFKEAYPDEADPITLRLAVHAITSFERTLISGRSAYDRWLAGDDDALSASAKRGFELFNGHPLECFHCHGDFNFTDSVAYVGNTEAEPRFHNTGLYNIDGKGGYPEPNRGAYEISHARADMGAFRAPTLRNIAVTAPYMHDGSIATLSEVIDHYAAGGRTIGSGPNAGVGSKSPLKSNLIAGFPISAEERADLLAFLGSLTDMDFLHEPRFADPWASVAP